MKKSIYIVLAGIGFLSLAFFLKEVFSGNLVLSPTINFGIFSIRYYGIFVALAAAAGLLLAFRRGEKYKIEHKEMENIVLLVLIFGLLGARIYHVISAYDYYLENPLQIVQIWHGGLAIYGGIFGGVIGLWLFNRLVPNRLSLIALLDWLTPSLLLGQLIGRFGNLFNYELYGYPANLPWKMFVPTVFRNQSYFDSSFFHPLFLYESLGCAFILFLLVKFSKSQFFKTPGKLFFTYLLLYNVLRFSLEFLRIDTTIWAGFRINLVISVALVIISALYIRFKNEAKTT